MKYKNIEATMDVVNQNNRNFKQSKRKERALAYINKKKKKCMVLDFFTALIVFSLFWLVMFMSAL